MNKLTHFVTWSHVYNMRGVISLYKSLLRKKTNNKYPVNCCNKTTLATDRSSPSSSSSSHFFHGYLTNNDQ